MTAVFGVSIGATSVRLARTAGLNAVRDASSDGDDALVFEKKVLDATRSSAPRVAARAVRSLLNTEGADTPIVVTYSDVTQSAVTRAELAVESLGHIHLTTETSAAMELIGLTRLVDGYDTIALYDLGATGLVVTVVDTGTGKALGSARSTIVSGDLFDRVVRDHLVRSGILQEPADPQGDRETMKFCRGVKESLSTASLAQTPGGDTLLMTRGQFDQYVYLAVEESAKIISEVGLRCHRTAQAVVLLGGGGRIPVVRTVLQRWLGVPVVVPDEPEMVIAKGAALYSAGLLEHVADPAPDDGSDAPVGFETATSVDVGGDNAEPSVPAVKPPVLKPPVSKPAVTKTAATSRPLLPAEEQTVSFTAVGAAGVNETAPMSVVVVATPDAAADVPALPHAAETDEPSDTPAPATSRIPRLKARLPMFAGLVLTMFAIASVLMWAVAQPSAEASDDSTQSTTSATVDNAAGSDVATTIAPAAPAPVITSTAVAEDDSSATSSPSSYEDYTYEQYTIAPTTVPVVPTRNPASTVATDTSAAPTATTSESDPFELPEITLPPIPRLGLPGL